MQIPAEISIAWAKNQAQPNIWSCTLSETARNINEVVSWLFVASDALQRLFGRVV